MPTFLKDTEVAALLAELKPLPDDYRTRLQVKPNRYQDFATALRCLVQECGFQLPANDQGELFNQ